MVKKPQNPKSGKKGSLPTEAVKNVQGEAAMGKASKGKSKKSGCR